MLKYAIKPIRDNLIILAPVFVILGYAAGYKAATQHAKDMMEQRQPLIDKEIINHYAKGWLDGYDTGKEGSEPEKLYFGIRSDGEGTDIYLVTKGGDTVYLPKMEIEFYQSKPEEPKEASDNDLENRI